MPTSYSTATSNDYQLKWLYSLVIALLAASFAALPAPAVAQTNPITLDVHPGYEGTFRIGEWFPVQIQLANDGPDVSGTLTWSLPGQVGEGIFEHTIELPRGARKRVTLYAYSRNFARNGRIQLRNGPNVLVEQDTRLEAADSNEFLVGVFSSDPTLLNSVNALQSSASVSTSVRHMALEALPDQLGALRGLDVVVLHDVDTSTLSAQQRQALELWVQNGGRLIVSGGPDSKRLTAGIADLLPAEIGDSIAQANLDPLVRLATADAQIPALHSDATPTQVATTNAAQQGTPTPAAQSVAIPSPGSAPLNAVTPGAKAQLLPNTGVPLLLRHLVGNGDVTLTTFDLARLRGWTGEGQLWQNLLSDMASTSQHGRTQQDNLLQQVLRLPSLNLLSVQLLLVLLLLYLLAIGPLNYFVLRRIGRLEWAWLSIPATVIIFSAAFYVVGFQLRGGSSQVHQVAFVQAVEGRPLGAATAFIGLFSPQRASYDLSFKPDALVHEPIGFSEGLNNVAVIQSTAADVHVPDLLVDVSSVRSLTIETALESPVRVTSTLQVASNAVNGQIRNAGDTALEDAIVVRGDQYQALGTLAAGASQTIALHSGGTQFPWGVTVAPIGVFNRQEMLSTLFSSSNASQLLDQRGVYLLGWRSGAFIPVRVGGQNTNQDGVTLYIVRLSGT